MLKVNSNRIDPKLFGILKEKLKLTKDGVNKKIKKLRDDRGFDISRGNAALLLASINKIDITKFADDEKLKEIRNLKDSGYQIINNGNKTKEKDRVLRIKDITIKSREPFITKDVISNSQEMSQYYAMLFILENSLRNFIREVYKNDKDYWNKKVPAEIKTEVTKIKSKEKYFEEGRDDELEYAHLDFLKQIIVHNWNEFSLSSKEKDKTKFINEVEKFMPCRHAVAHTTRLKGLDAKRCQYRTEEILKMF